MSESFFSKLSDDIMLKILYNLEEDPRNWARIACVSTKFSSLITNICCKSKCLQSIRAVVYDLIPYGASPAVPPGGWASLYKLAVCCPGLLHSGVHIGPDDNHHENNADPELNVSIFEERAEIPQIRPEIRDPEPQRPDLGKRKKNCRSVRSHLASGIWNLSREQGNKLLGSRFKGDCLYICDWPGCMHVEEKRNYMLFRGIFKDFKQSRVWRTINDGNKNKVDLICVFCSSNQIWDLHSSFCLRRYFGYHEDGDPVVRAYVCENGHVSGAWTDWPLYT